MNPDRGQRDIKDYDLVFTPQSPVSADFFVGRRKELDSIEDCFRRPGLHVAIVGGRGVGKTSLGRYALRNYDPKPIRVPCESSMHFSTIVRKVLEATGRDPWQTEETSQVTHRVGGTAAVFSGDRTSTESAKRKGIGEAEIDAPTLLSIMAAARKRLVLVLDEFDAAPSAVKARIAALMKGLSDDPDYCDSRIVTIGIGRSLSDLMTEHVSLPRHIKEVRLQPLGQRDLLAFLEHAESELGFVFEAELKEELVGCSWGMPYFVHLVGFHSVREMLHRNKRPYRVTYEDYDAACRAAYKEAMTSIFRAHNATLKHLTPTARAILARVIRSRRVTTSELVDRLRLPDRSPDEVIAAINKLLELNLLNKAGLEEQERIGLREPGLGPFLQGRLFGYRRPSQRALTDERQQLLQFEDATPSNPNLALHETQEEQ